MSAVDLTSPALVKAWLEANAAFPAWAAGTVYALNAQIIDPSLHVQKCTVPGTSGGTIPTFNDSGGSITEGPTIPPLQWTDQGLTQDSIISEGITAFSLDFLKMTGLGPQNGTPPTESPFVQVCSYDEWYDGSGSNRQFVRNRPIRSVTSVTMDGIAIPQSSGPTVPGWVIDGSGKSISLRGNASRPGFAALGSYLRNPGVQWLFLQNPQNVEIVYTAGYDSTPVDIQRMATRVVGNDYRRHPTRTSSSRALAQGAGTTTSRDWAFSEEDWRVILAYRRTSFV